METVFEYKQLLNRLKKNELSIILKDYNKFACIFNLVEVKDVSGKKDKLIKDILEVKKDYVKAIIMCLDLSGYEALKVIVTKKYDETYLNEHRDLINYLIDKKILWQMDNLIIAQDVLKDIKEVLKDKTIINHISKWDKTYRLVNGIIIAYGAVERKYFDILISKLKNKDNIYPMLEVYYKRDYSLEDSIVSNKLTNQKRINKYLKDINYKDFKMKDFVEMGSSVYHHNIKSYKTFIRVLKRNYIFSKEDIAFVDNNIVIPYLYNSLNEEKIANKNLEDTIINLFEFKGDKLKQKILTSVKLIREDFPLWEYRGFSKKEVNK